MKPVKGNRLKRKIISYILSAVCVVTLLFSNSVPAYAASAQAYISCPTQVTVGDTFTATFTIESQGDSLGIIYGTIQYDSSILSCNGYAGTINIPETVPGDAAAVATYSVSYDFKVIAAGRASMSVNFGLETLVNGEIINNVASSVAITASNPYVASSNCALTSLLTSEGYVDVAKRNFTINVPNKTTTFALNAATADANATWGVISGAQYLDNLQEGSNVIVLRVTAEDKVTYEDYTFTVIREPGATPTPGPTATPTPTPTSTPTPTPVEQIPVDVSDGSRLYIDFSDVKVPNGYKEETYEYHGRTVPAATLGNMVLLPLADETGGSVGWYLYDEEKDVCVPYTVLKDAAISYVVLDMPGDMECPYGYGEGTLQIQNVDYRIYRQEAQTAEMLLYLMDPAGEKGLYRFNDTTKQVYPYAADAYEEYVPDENEEPAEVDDSLLQEKEEQYQKLQTEYEAYQKQASKTRMVLFIAIVLLVIVLAIAVLLLFLRNKEDDSPDDPDDTDDETREEQKYEAQSSEALFEAVVDVTGETETCEIPETEEVEEHTVPEDITEVGTETGELPEELRTAIAANIEEMTAEEDEAEDILIVNGVEAAVIGDIPEKEEATEEDVLEQTEESVTEELPADETISEAVEESGSEGIEKPVSEPENVGGPEAMPVTPEGAEEDTDAELAEPEAVSDTQETTEEEYDDFPDADDVPDLDDIPGFDDEEDNFELESSPEANAVQVTSESTYVDAEKGEEPGKFRCHYEDDDEEDGEWILDPDDEEL